MDTNASFQTIYDSFALWLDEILKEKLPDDVKAIHFNLYDDGDNAWSCEIIGAPYFEEDDDDWACHEIFTSRNHPFMFHKQCTWIEIEDLFKQILLAYLRDGAYANTLKLYLAVSMGFVDGDLYIIYQK